MIVAFIDLPSTINMLQVKMIAHGPNKSTRNRDGSTFSKRFLSPKTGARNRSKMY